MGVKSRNFVVIQGHHKKPIGAKRNKARRRIFHLWLPKLWNRNGYSCEVIRESGGRLIIKLDLLYFKIHSANDAMKLWRNQ